MANGNSVIDCTCDPIDTLTDGPFRAFTTRHHLTLSAANCTSSDHEYDGVSINRSPCRLFSCIYYYTALCTMREGSMPRI